MNNIHHERLRWACRRGMLELDLLLQPFCEKIFLQLDAHDQMLFERLLTFTDQQLFDWLVRYQEPSDPELIPLIERVRKGV